MLATQLIADLKGQGVTVFYGVQGGAAARLIEEVVSAGLKYIPVLNEQSAGYFAHGYYLATGRPAGLIFTTGPGFTNSISGIAACYYDSIPCVVLVGQVGTTLNVAKKYATKMVGFQEVDHIGLASPISDRQFSINTTDYYVENRIEILKNISNSVTVIQINDDIQRGNIAAVQEIASSQVLETITDKTIIEGDLDKLVAGLNSAKPIFLLGAGVRDSLTSNDIEWINSLNIPVAVTWGGQAISNNFSNCLGLFGTHSPGPANKAIKEATYVLALGVSLLQHQCGKDYSKFAPSAQIDFVNSLEGECRRVREFFCGRIHTINCDYQILFNPLKQSRVLKKDCPVQSRDWKDVPTIVSSLALLFRSYAENMGTHIYSDAGATLSWSYQAVNLLNPSNVKLFTAFNLHPMGYSNCAAIGANHGGVTAMAVIGDGSLPMNCQELAHASSAEKFKLVIVDNAGYGIIRQTQDDFYEGHHFGSSFESSAALPKFSVENILTAFGLRYSTVNVNDVDVKFANDFVKSTEVNALIIKLPFAEKVSTYIYS